jgi:hypothetical protein
MADKFQLLLGELSAGGDIARRIASILAQPRTSQGLPFP